MRTLILWTLLVLSSGATQEFLGMEHGAVVLVNTTVSCSLRTEWCFQIFFFEEDIIGMDDFSGKTAFKCSGKAEETNSTKLKFDEFDLAYHPIAHILHNCSNEGIVKKMVKDLDKIIVGRKRLHSNYKFDLTNGGVDYDEEVQKSERKEIKKEYSKWSTSKTSKD
ncbi:unnamed protein product [Caenorhabditis brenneri]